MKIVIINQHIQDAIGGSELQCDIIARQLMSFGHEIMYFAVNGKQNKYNTDYRVIPSALNMPTLSSAITKFKPDIVYWRFNKKRFLLSMIILKLFGTKVVFAVSSRNDLKKMSYRLLPLSKGFLRVLKNKYLVLKQLISSGVNQFGFIFVDGLVCQKKDDIGKLPIKKQKHINNSMTNEIVPFEWQRPFCVWVSNIKKIKNPDKYIRLAEHLQSGKIDFLMVGGIKQKQYKYIAEKDKMPSNLYYLGQKSIAEVNGIIDKSLFLVHTCMPEGFPNVFIQAWARSKPVVSLYYDPGKVISSHGLGFCSGDFDCFIRDTQMLINDAQLRTDMGEKARVFANENFDVQHNVRELESFFYEIMPKK